MCRVILCNLNGRRVTQSLTGVVSMADRPTEATAYGADNIATPLSKLAAYAGVSGVAL